MAIPSGGTCRYRAERNRSDDALSPEIFRHYAAAATVISSGAVCRYRGRRESLR